jgi:hypothetical protein
MGADRGAGLLIGINPGTGINPGIRSMRPLVDLAQCRRTGLRSDAAMAPRIVTVTLNPAIDLACTARTVVHTHKVRTRDEHIDPGGGGINVAWVLHALDADVTAWR